MIDLDELEKLEREATPGPWEWNGIAIEAGRTDVLAPGESNSFGYGTIHIAEEDKDLIAALRNAAPAMIAELRALRARVAELERDLQRDEPRAALAAILRELDALMRESEGVAGLHLNGNVATWEELETTWLSIEAVREWAAKFERDALLGAAVRAVWKDLDPDVRVTTTGAFRVGLTAARHFEAEESTDALRAEEPEPIYDVGMDDGLEREEVEVCGARCGRGCGDD